VDGFFYILSLHTLIWGMPLEETVLAAGEKIDQIVAWRI
jgi:hypothetical protein